MKESQVDGKPVWIAETSEDLTRGVDTCIGVSEWKNGVAVVFNRYRLDDGSFDVRRIYAKLGLLPPELRKMVPDLDDDLGDVQLGEASCEMGEACESCQ